MKLAYAKGLPLCVELLMLLLCGASIFAASKEDKAFVRGSGGGPAGIRLTEKK